MNDFDELSKMSLKELEKIAKKEIAKANRKIEKLGVLRGDSSAYSKIEALEGSPYIYSGEHVAFKMPEASDNLQRTNQLREAIGKAQRFTESATSTKTGIEAVKRNHRKWIRANFDGFSRNAAADDFLKFLGRDDIREQMKNFDSNVIVEALAKANRQKGNETLLEMYENFKKSGKSYGAWIIELDNSAKNQSAKRIDF